jgi:hypothetical protein
MLVEYWSACLSVGDVKLGLLDGWPKGVVFRGELLFRRFGVDLESVGGMVAGKVSKVDYRDVELQQTLITVSRFSNTT